MKPSEVKIGAIVHCPADRGDAPYTSRVVHIDPTSNKNIHGVEYVWVTVHRSDTHTNHVWPSHRLN